MSDSSSMSKIFFTHFLQKKVRGRSNSHQYGESRPSLSSGYGGQRLLATGPCGFGGAVQPWKMLPGQHFAVTPVRPSMTW